MDRYSEADRRVWDVLDNLEITEYGFHDSNFARPMVSHLVDGVINSAPVGGRVLVVGGNRLLLEALQALGYQVENWEYGRQSSEIQAAVTVSARLSARDLTQLNLPDGVLKEAEYSVIVLPMVLETLAADLRPILSRFNLATEEHGALIAATTNLFKLGTRWRAVLGRGFLPGSRAVEAERAGGWHTLPPRRFYSLGELETYAEVCGYRIEESRYSSGYRIYDEQRPLGPGGWIKALMRQGVVRALPDARSYLITYWQKS